MGKELPSSRMARVGVVLEYQVGVRGLICNPAQRGRDGILGINWPASLAKAFPSRFS